MRREWIVSAVILAIGGTLAAQEAQWEKVPSGVILVRSTEPGASDASTPLPEGGRVVKNVYENAYFGLSYRLPQDWAENFSGPPPSDSGSYVLAQFGPGPNDKRRSKGTMLVVAHDLFFTLAPAHDAAGLVRYTTQTLPSYYEIERPPAALKIANRPFLRFDYKSEVANLHWFVLTTEVRCHALQFIFTANDVELLESLVKELGGLKLGADGDAPLCIADYATEANLVSKVEPVLVRQKFNPIPVRILIDEEGRVRHVHLISAFRDQVQAITDAVMQWRFKPYEKDGKRREIETGIVFGFPQQRPDRATASAAVD